MGSKRVVVVGAGNAALCAALAAREAGAEVVVLERAPFRERGGNSSFTAGAMRFVYEGVDDIRGLVPDLTDEQVRTTDFGSYSSEQFIDDIARASEYRSDPDLVEILVKESTAGLRWLKSQGVSFLPIYGRQAFNVDGRYTFWGGLTVEAVGGGPGLVDSLTRAAGDAGIHIEYDSRALSLVTEGWRVVGVRVRRGDELETIDASAVVLACGGFEANAEWRARYLGWPWDMAKVRGSRFNTGDGIRMALDIGAMPWGNWTGAHAVAWEYNAPPFGDLEVGDSFQKHSYPFSVMINQRGARFVDEGADFRNYTYAKYGAQILRQPGQMAWQVFDASVSHLLRDEYRIRQVTRVTGQSLEELARRMDGVDQTEFLRTIHEYNAAVSDERPFNPNVKDGRRTVGLGLDKTNWAQAISVPPFEAYAVTCGITFTFGGLRITPDAQVLSDEEVPIEGLFACGELVGGIFYFNYPGGSGLTNGTVFGRRAGVAAARAAS